MKQNTKNEINLYTKNSIIECLKSDTKINSITILKSTNTDKRIQYIIENSQKRNIQIEYVDTIDELNKIANNNKHQKIIAHLSKTIKTYEINEIINNEKNERPLILICDNITDTSNLGNIIRSAEVFGVNGIIISKKNFNTLVNENTFKTSCGAIFNMQFCIVSNINSIIEKLKKQNIWIMGTIISNDKILYPYNVDLKLPLAIVLGSEDNGLNELTKKKCDFLITIPMFGKISSLNVNNASAILLYEVIRQRNYNKK